MIRSYKRKLILTEAQANRLNSWIGACRVVYNLGLSIRISAFQSSGKSVHKFALASQIKDIRADYEWVKDVPFDTLMGSLNRLDNAYKNFFSTYKTGGGFPKFASKRKGSQSIRIKTVKVCNNSVIIPKIGALKIFKDRPILGTVKEAVIKKESTGYFITIQCDDVPKKFISDSQAIGLDMGISKFCTDSYGGFIDNPRHFKFYERKLRIETKSLSRKKKGSESWLRQCKKLSKLHGKISNVRKDFLHKESTKIAKANSVVYMEDLNIKGMSHNKKLSKHILDCGWGMFRSMLEYKTRVVVINPKFTSQKCSGCGKVDSKSRISQSEYCCTSCGHVDHADINAAKNIKEKGILLDRQREAVACA